LYKLRIGRAYSRNPFSRAAAATGQTCGGAAGGGGGGGGGGVTSREISNYNANRKYERYEC